MLKLKLLLNPNLLFNDHRAGDPGPDSGGHMKKIVLMACLSLVGAADAANLTRVIVTNRPVPVYNPGTAYYQSLQPRIEIPRFIPYGDPNVRVINVVTEPVQPAYSAQPAPAATQSDSAFVYFCASTQRYYPDVETCSTPWQPRVPGPY